MGRLKSPRMVEGLKNPSNATLTHINTKIATKSRILTTRAYDKDGRYFKSKSRLNRSQLLKTVAGALNSGYSTSESGTLLVYISLTFIFFSHQIFQVGKGFLVVFLFFLVDMVNLIGFFFILVKIYFVKLFFVKFYYPDFLFLKKFRGVLEYRKVLPEIQIIIDLLYGSSLFHVRFH